MTKSLSPGTMSSITQSTSRREPAVRAAAMPLPPPSSAVTTEMAAELLNVPLVSTVPLSFLC